MATSFTDGLSGEHKHSFVAQGNAVFQFLHSASVFWRK